jgi:proline iminopeptidase
MTSEDEELFGAEHVRAYQETDGERGYRWRNGTEILLLTTKGSKSGEMHTTPLIHRTDGDNFVIVASKGGTPENPAWYENIQANPNDVSIQVKGDKFAVTASDAEGEERARLWDHLAEVWPDYNNYQANTDREIPVVVLARR